MATFALESNGRLEKTAIYFNGETLGGIKEVFLNLDEEGTFDAILQYEGTDRVLYTKQIFQDYLENIKVVEPPFDEEEAEELQLLEIESSGDIADTLVLYNGEELQGLISLFVHIKGAQSKNGIRAFFSGKKEVPEHVEFRADFTFRNDDGTISEEGVF